MSAFAWMANTIVPIAGKLAKYEWRIPMTDEPVRVVFRIGPDPLLANVIRSAVRFQALQAGMDDEACGKFAAAYEGVCRNSLSQIADGGRRLDVTIETFADRIELAIHCHGQSLPSVGLQVFVGLEDGATDDVNAQELLSQVDQILYNAEEGTSRTTLVKYFAPKP
jgi:hypothetical protein